jgi:large subunit ribosomal protein L22
MAISATIKYLRISPRKVRMVADMIRYKPVGEAEAILKFTARKASKPLLKLLESSIANATNNFKKDAATLYITSIKVDGGPILKRTMPRSRGTAFAIQKKTSHITMVLGENGEKTEKEPVKVKTPKVKNHKETAAQKKEPAAQKI